MDLKLPPGDPDLIDALREAVKSPQTLEDKREQMVSYVYAELGHKSKLSRDEVRRMVYRHQLWGEPSDDNVGD